MHFTAFAFGAKTSTPLRAVSLLMSPYRSQPWVSGQMQGLDNGIDMHCQRSRLQHAYLSGVCLPVASCLLQEPLECLLA